MYCDICGDDITLAEYDDRHSLGEKDAHAVCCLKYGPCAPVKVVKEFVTWDSPYPEAIEITAPGPGHADLYEKSLLDQILNDYAEKPKHTYRCATCGNEKESALNLDGFPCGKDLSEQLDVAEDFTVLCRGKLQSL